MWSNKNGKQMQNVQQMFDIEFLYTSMMDII